MLSNSKIDFIIAEPAGQPVACGSSRIENVKHYFTPEEQAYLGMMYVMPEDRGKGINARILETIMSLVKERAITELYLEVFSSNQAAIRAYQKAGSNRIF